MTRHSNIAASPESMTGPARCDLAAVNEAGGQPFKFRRDLCEHCCRGIQTLVENDGSGFYERACDECVAGEVDAACADCLVVRPLNDEGFCEPCADASELPIAEYNAKYPVCSMALHRAVLSGWKEAL